MISPRLLLPICLIVALPACQTELPGGPWPPVDVGDADACGASQMQDLVGQPSSVVMAMTFAQPMRLIRPGEAVTMDYSAERLNITLDEAEMIASVTCG